MPHCHGQNGICTLTKFENSFSVEGNQGFFMQAVRRFFQEVSQEVSKVTWPSMQDVRASSVVVVMMMIIFGTFFLIIDKVFSAVILGFIGQ